MDQRRSSRTNKGVAPIRYRSHSTPTPPPLSLPPCHMASRESSSDRFVGFDDDDDDDAPAGGGEKMDDTIVDVQSALDDERGGEHEGCGNAASNEGHGRESVVVMPDADAANDVDRADPRQDLSELYNMMASLARDVRLAGERERANQKREGDMMRLIEGMQRQLSIAEAGRLPPNRLGASTAATQRSDPEVNTQTMAKSAVPTATCGLFDDVCSSTASRDSTRTTYGAAPSYPALQQPTAAQPDGPTSSLHARSNQLSSTEHPRSGAPIGYMMRGESQSSAWSGAALEPPRACEHRRLLDLPTFSGRAEDWPRFEAAYINTTETYRYTDTDNLYRLQRALSGDAERSVESLLIQPHHVNDVMEVLRDTFGHPDLLVRSQIERARKLPRVDEARLEQLVPFANVVRNVATYLDSPTTQHHLANPTLLDELIGKLPIARRVDWAGQAASIRPYPTVRDFSKWLSGVARIVNLVAPLSSTDDRAGRGGGKTPMRRVLFNSADFNPRECDYCAKAHDVQDCNAFKRLSAEDRWRAVTERSLCFSCLSAEHLSPNCDDIRECATNGCTKWHHPLLHERRNANRQPKVTQGRQTGSSAPNRSIHTGVDYSEMGPARADQEFGATQDELPRGWTRTSQPANRQQQPSTTRGAASSRRDERVNMLTQPEVPATAVDETADNNTEQVCVAREGSAKSTLLYRILPVVLHANGQQVKTFALLDEGSSVTLIDDSLVDEMRLDGPTSDLSMRWIGKQTTVVKSRKITFGISGVSPHDERTLVVARAIRNLSLPRQTVEPAALYNANPHLMEVPLVAYSNAIPRILIGLDNHQLSKPRELKWGDNSDDESLSAVRTKLVWVLYGSQGPEYLPNATVLLIDGERDAEYDMLNEVIRSYIATEEFGVRKSQALIESDDNIRARNILSATTKLLEGRYETGLLWSTDIVKLPNSYDMALRRLRSVEAKMRREPEFGEQYAAQIEAYVAKGYAKKLSEAEVRRYDGRTWYLPHFAVRNPNKPGKFRLVFDAAAKVGDTSLNSVLLPGPDLNVPLVRLLFRFRLGLVGICADIREMFHQVRIRAEDQSAQRFLWRSGDASKPPAVYAMVVMTFGAACSPTSAQYVKNANAAEHEEEYPDAAAAIRERHYVDDFVASFATVEEAARVTGEVVEVHRRGGFCLRGFLSNDKRVLELLGSEAVPDQSVKLDRDATVEKILGMSWCTSDDTFCFQTQFPRVHPDVLSGLKRATKRTILSTSMSVFDPFGLLANFTLPPKVLVQELYRLGLGWDDPVPDNIHERWQAWRSQIEYTQLLRVPRCYAYNINTTTDLQLHIFADASEEAFAAVAFWRISGGGGTQLSFVAGKVKVAPIQLISIPRLELNAAVLATRLLNEIRRSHDLKITKTVLWSDSETVLKWIRSDQRLYKPYVGFRVAEIVESAPSSSWRWVPTAMNVADEATRVQHPPRFDPESRWVWGPEWLRESEESWPVQSAPATPNEENRDELRARFVCFAADDIPFEYERFSTFIHLCRTIGWARRFVNNAAAKGRGEQRRRGELTAREMDDSTRNTCRVVQQEAFRCEYSALKAGLQIDKSSDIFILKPYLDAEGLIRLHGRADAAADEHLAPDAKRPILLPRRHRFTMLLVRHHHEQMAHQMMNATIAAVRRKFWVPQIRVLVRSVQQACQACKNRASMPMTPVMGQLPRDRLTPYMRPFTHTGMDYFGPVIVKIGRRLEKRWVALFTCLVVRAVHLEIAADLSTDACLVCIRNLANIRGVPSLLRCDNGTNFIGARNLMGKDGGFFDPNALQRELSIRGIEWRMNCPGNPEAGGAWERLVQSVKRVLAITLKEVTPAVETLRAHLLEAANLVNSRPLTHLPVAPDEDEALTPNHFLMGGPNTSTAPDPADPRSLCTRKQWELCREMSRRFWKQWVRDYLPELTKRSKHYPECKPLKEDDIVIVCDSAQPRGRWLRGRILKTRTGPDGRVRTALVKTSDGEFWRPVVKLAVLDVRPALEQPQDGARDVAI